MIALDLAFDFVGGNHFFVENNHIAEVDFFSLFSYKIAFLVKLGKQKLRQILDAKRFCLLLRHFLV